MSVRAAAMRNRLPRTAAAVALLGLLALAGVIAWLGSPAGLDWVARQAVRAGDGRLTLGGVEGSLFGEIRIRELDYAADGLSLQGEQLALRWQPWALLAGELRLSRATAAMVRYSGGAAAPATVPETLALPIGVVATEISIGHLEAVGMPPVVNLRMSYDGRGLVHRLRLTDMHSAGWNFDGTWAMDAQPPFAVGGSLHARNDGGIEAAATITGRLEALQVSAMAGGRGSTAKLAVLLNPYAATAVESLELRAENLDLSAWHAPLPQTSIALKADARRSSDGMLEGGVRANNNRPGRLDENLMPVASAAVDFRNTGSHLAFSGFSLHMPGDGRMQGQGTLQDGVLRARLTAQGIDPSRLHGRLRATTVSGRANFTGDQGRQHVDALLDGAGLHLQLTARHAGGVLDLDRAQLSAGNGRLGLSGRITLAGAQPFSASGSFTRLDPSRFLQVPPAQISGTLAAEGQLAGDWLARVQLAVSGSRLRNAPLSAQADFTTSRVQLFAGKMQAAIGDNRVSVTGRHGQPQDRLQWQVDAADLRAIDPSLSGSLHGKGTFSGTPGTPAVTFDLSGRQLAFGGFGASRIALQGSLDEGAGGALRIEADAAGLRMQQTQFGALRLRGSGTRAQHTLQAELLGKDTRLTLRMAGGLDLQWQWNGTLEQFEAAGRWPVRLTAPAAITAGPGLLVVEQLQVATLDGEFGPASLRAEKGRIDTSGHFRGMAVDGFLGRGAVIASRNLRLGGQWALNLGNTLSGSAKIFREQGDLEIAGDERVAFELSRLGASLAATDNRIEITFEAQSARMGKAAAQLQTQIAKHAGQWRLPADAPLAGNATVDMQSLAWARALLPGVDRVDGRLAAKATIGGTVADPQIAGELDGQGITIRALGPGVDLRDGRLNLTILDNILKIKDFFIKAGTGHITADGQAMLARGLRNLDINAHAERAQIVATPQLTIVASGSGRAGLRDRRLALEGRFRLDEGRYDLGSAGRPTLGNDVIVRRAESGTPKKPAPLAVALDVGLDLNDRFTVRGHGLDALLGGNVRITSRGDALSAVGTVRTVRGEYSAYGQRLTIERGALMFSGPLGNPGLDLRAMRKMQTVEVGVEVSGSLQRPAARLVSTPDMPDSDRLGWLVLGRDPRSADRAEMALLQAAALGIASRGGKPLQQQLAEEIGLDDLGFTRGADGTLGVLALGKHITSQVSVRLEQSLGGTAGSLIVIDYLLSERWRLRGTTGAENAGDILFSLRFD